MNFYHLRIFVIHCIVFEAGNLQIRAGGARGFLLTMAIFPDYLDKYFKFNIDEFKNTEVECAVSELRAKKFALSFH